MHQNQQDDDGADNGKEKSGGVEERSILGSGKNAGDQSADDRADDPDNRRHPKAEVSSPRDDGMRNETDNETNNDRPDDMEHKFFRLPTFLSQ